MNRNEFNTLVDAVFGKRQLSPPVIEGERTTPEQADALWFSGKRWRDVTRAEWIAHADAFYVFSPPVFLYFLPSIFILSLECPINHFSPAENLIGILDRSPTPEYWDDFLLTRMLGLTSEEYSVISQWLMEIDGLSGYYELESVSRAFDTIQLLDSESRRLNISR